MPDDSYHNDIMLWSRSQADRLRRVAAGERVNAVDWEHVIEEVEDLGNSQLSGVKSLLIQAMLHGLKCFAWPGHRSVGHWQHEIAAFLADAQDGFQPGMQQLGDPAALYARAVQRLHKLPPMDGAAPRPVPAKVTFTAAELRDEDFGATDLLDRIRAALPPTG